MATENGPDELAKILRELNDLSRGRFIRHVTRPLAAEAIARIKNCFVTSTTPYGDTWAPVARGGKPLLKSARLARAFQDASTPERLVINNPTVYGPLQNYGGFVVARDKPYLVFQVEQPGAPVATRGGAVVKRRRTTKQWVKVKMVYIEARQFLPDDRGLPPAWEASMALIARHLFIKKYPSLSPARE